jgi:tetrahydromethanopterin S-methyltransferase subunit D
MRARFIIAAMLFILTFGGIGFSLGLAGIYCKQLFNSQSVPLICADEQPGASTLFKVTMNVSEWILLFGVPTTITVTYARFGWPRMRREPSQKE